MPPHRLITFELGEEVAFTVPFHLTAREEPKSAPAPLQPPAPTPAAVPGPEGLTRPLDRLLATLVSLGGSDLHLSAGVRPMMRLHGDMTPVPGVELVLTSEHILLMFDEIAPAHNRKEFRETNDTDFAYELPGMARLRVNMFRDRRGAGPVFRQIPHRILSLDELGLPECVKTLCMLTKGLVLVAGPTGSGKSTPLAAMVDYINQNRSAHIITIEDPVEFVHENKRCLIHRREVYSPPIPSRRHCAPPCARTRTWCWWASCAIWKPWPSPSKPPKPATWFSVPCTLPLLLPPWTASLTSSQPTGSSRSA